MYWCMVTRICRKLDLNLFHTSIFRKLFDAGKSWVRLVTFYVQFWCSGAAVNKKFERFSQLMSLTLIHLFLNLTNCARNEYTVVKLVSHSQHICILAGFVSLKLNLMRTFLGIGCCARRQVSSLHFYEKLSEQQAFRRTSQFNIGFVDTLTNDHNKAILLSLCKVGNQL